MSAVGWEMKDLAQCRAVAIGNRQGAMRGPEAMSPTLTAGSQGCGGDCILRMIRPSCPAELLGLSHTLTFAVLMHRDIRHTWSLSSLCLRWQASQASHSRGQLHTHPRVSVHAEISQSDVHVTETGSHKLRVTCVQKSRAH